MSSAMEWDELRKEVRKIESELELKLVSYSKCANTYITETTETQKNENMFNVCTSMTVEIQQLTDKLSQLNTKLVKYVQQNSKSNSSHILEHHRDKLRDFTNEFFRIKNKVTNAHNHIELLEGSNLAPGGMTDEEANAMDVLLRERNSLNSSNNHAENFLERGAEVRQQFRDQTNLLSSQFNRLKNVHGDFDGISNIFRLINRKYSRDCIILSSFVVFLTFLLFLSAKYM